MKSPNIYKIKKLIPIIFTFIITTSIFMILFYPSEIITTTKDALNLWASIVVPSLLPFFIGAEILVGLGVVKFIGVLLEPFMTKYFKVPGEASFIFTMSMTSGYPIGVKLASKLESLGTVTTSEAQRISSFASTSGPLFIFGAVAVGMFHSPKVGYIIGASHYLGAIMVGIVMALFARDVQYKSIPSDENIIMKSVREMDNARRKDGRSLGKLLSDAVMESISTLLLIGGILVIFSVFIKEIQILGVPDFIIHLINNNPSGKLNELVNICLYGMTEITLGSRSCASATFIDYNTRIVLATMIISWSGLSIHAQVASVLSNSKISMPRYIFSKLLHTLFSGIVAFIIVRTINIRPIVSAFMQKSNTTGLLSLSYLSIFILSIKLFLLICSSLILIGLIYQFLKKR